MVAELAGLLALLDLILLDLRLRFGLDVHRAMLLVHELVRFWLDGAIAELAHDVVRVHRFLLRLGLLVLYCALDEGLGLQAHLLNGLVVIGLGHQLLLLQFCLSLLGLD